MSTPKLFFFALVLIAACARGQAAPDKAKCISGKISDVNGKPLAGVSVAIKNAKTNQQVIVTSDKAGRFSAECGESGDCLATVEPPQNLNASGIRVTLDIAKPHCPPKHRGKARLKQ